MKGVIKYKLLSFDLSKSNTGMCICYLDNDFKIIDIFTKSLNSEITPYYGNSIARDCHFFEIGNLCDQIKKELNKEDFITFLTVEYPIFHSFTTELSYYYFQSVLKVAFDCNIDVIGVVPMSLKKFIGELYTISFSKKLIKKGRVLDKSEIKFVFDSLKSINYFEKLNIKCIPKNNDEMDSFFLMLYILSSFNKNYLDLLDKDFLNPRDYETLEYLPIEENKYNLENHIDSDFFTLKDRKFYPLKYIKKCNFI